MLTNQQIFDAVTTWLFAQNGKKSTGRLPSGLESCLYRNNNSENFASTRCAMGLFIPDALYDDRLEGCGIKDTVMKGRVHSLFPENSVLASYLQGVHDQNHIGFGFSSRNDYLRYRLNLLAKDFNLSSDLVTVLFGEDKNEDSVSNS